MLLITHFSSYVVNDIFFTKTFFILLMTYFLYRTDSKLQDAINYFIPKFQGFVLDMYDLRDKIDEHIEYGLD